MLFISQLKLWRLLHLIISHLLRQQVEETLVGFDSHRWIFGHLEAFPDILPRQSSVFFSGDLFTGSLNITIYNCAN